jgi:uncharacterized protein DUF4154
VVLLLLFIFTSSTRSRQVEAQTPNEYHIKAACLFNFVKFVEWPAEAFADGGAPFVIGVVGQDPFGGALDQAVSGKYVDGRQLAIRRLKWGQDLRACHMLFISSSERKRLAQIIESLKGASVLTVGETEQFNQQGGIINFILDASKVRFEININVAEQARLKISSKLLSLVRTVRS